jgi:glycosyltransferase involved in cell wall biosynthesis
MDNKIAYLCLSKSSGGLEYHAVNLSRWMKERGSDILLIISEGSSVKNDIIKNSLKYAEIEKPRKYYAFGKAKKIADLILKNKLKILICGDNNDLNFASLVKIICGKRIKLIYLQQMQIGVKKKDILHNITHSKVDKWVVPLEYLKNNVIEKTNVKAEKISIIKYGTETRKFSQMRDKMSSRKILGLPEESFIIGILGRIDKLKGQDFLIESVQNIRQKYGLNLKLVIAGNPTKDEGEGFLKELEDRIEKYSLQNNVIFKGRVDEPADFYSAIDLFAMSSHSESYGLVTIESMLAGIPIIGTNTGGTPEILKQGEYGILFSQGNVEDFSEKVIDVYRHYDVYLNKAKSAREFAMKEYSHTRECEELEKLF